MKKTGWTILLYALLVFLGGIFGYVKAGSVASLVMGVGFSTILGVSAFAVFNGKKYGYYTAAAATTLLTLFFAYRFLLTYKYMPAGVMCLISAAVLVILLIRRNNWK